MEPWTHAALWQIWRCGVPDRQCEALQKFSGMMGVQREKIVETLVEVGFVDIVPKITLDGTYVSLLKITGKGLDLVYEDEGARWRDALKQLPIERPTGNSERAYLLKLEGHNLSKIGAIMKLSRERVRELAAQHERRLKAYQERVDMIDRFINGETPFKDLSVEVIGPFSVRLYNTLDRVGIQTVPQLLVTTGSQLLRVKNCGRKQIHEINDRLAELQVPPLEWGPFFDPRFLRDP
jgi:hypothetical protein